MEKEYLNITLDNIDEEHLSCLIRSKPNIGIEAKKAWLKKVIPDGHVLRKLKAKGTAMIEFAPLEKAWVPIVGNNYIYIYCLWVDGEFKGQGIGKDLYNYCLEEAKRLGKSGICMLGAKKQKHWLTSQEFMKKQGFEVVDETKSGYQLYALSFDGTFPHFTSSAKSEYIDEQGLVIYYSDECPFIRNFLEKLDLNNLKLIHVDTLEKAKQVPAPFNNFAYFFNGEFKSVNLLDSKTMHKLIGN